MIENLLTFGDICRALPGVPYHRIRYVLNTRKIEPAARFATRGLYAPDVIEKVGNALHAIDQRREVPA